MGSEYEDLTVEELKEDLADRGLPVSGNKAELIERLETADAGDEAPEDEPAATFDDSVINQALELEEPLRAAADALPPSDNSDALKWALRQAVHGIAAIRKAQDQIDRLAAAR